METKEKVKKLCSFYVSDIHFGTMLLPYISKKIEEGNSIYTVFEKDMYKNIEKIISKLSLNKEIREEIKNINWNKKIDKREIKEYINNIKEDSEVILVMGKKKYIDKANKKLDKQIKKEDLEKVTIINCYNVDVFNEHMGEILDKHSGILNTAGERRIEA